MADTKKTDAAPEKAKSSGDFVSANRETVESIVVAVILALMFRAFIAEAFVIPTGSMAPTLMGRHVDVWCDDCGYHYQASGSAERNKDDAKTGLLISDSRCPNCGHWKDLDLAAWSNERSMSGDRIIVSKFAYELADPQRFDVIVFKNPEAAQINFIKRLIGLPNETVRVSGGNIYTMPAGESEFAIARKDDDKLLALLQIVHDSDYPSQKLQKLDWPAWWQPHAENDQWKSNDAGKTHTVEAASRDAWLRYHHVYPEPDWTLLNMRKTDESWRQHREAPADWRGGLISDFYAYNCELVIDQDDPDQVPGFGRELSPAFGQYWVDDLAVECEVELGEATGEVLLDLVRAGIHYTCRIDASTGGAVLSAHNATGDVMPFTEGEAEQAEAKAQTSVKGAGTYRLRMSNVDHELRLWVNGWRVKFDGPTAFASQEIVLPDLTSTDGDLAPVGIGAANQVMTVRHLKVLRDKYYIARDFEYDESPRPQDDRRSPQQEIVHILAEPTEENLYPLLNSRVYWQVTLKDGQYLPLGDNSPASSDARYWSEPFVRQHLLVGKAVFIYWPHTWNMPPFFPNFRRMKPIQ